MFGSPSRKLQIRKTKSQPKASVLDSNILFPYEVYAKGFLWHHIVGIPYRER